VNAELKPYSPPSDGLAPVFAQYAIEIASAEGVWLTTRDGRKVLDMYGGHAVAALGYRHAGWMRALARQSELVSFQTNAVPMEIRARAARRLLQFAALPMDSVFFINSGAEANENALKMAFKMRAGRTHVAAVELGWHGRTAATATVTDGAAAKWYHLPRPPFDVSWIPRRDPGAAAAHITENTAAVIVEPVQGVGGAFDLGHEYLAELRRQCDRVGALLIFDEVQCGVGRTGKPFGANYFGVVPDMITTAKALGNGFPVSALIMSRDVTAALKSEGLGTTFGGGPMACAVVEAVIDAIEREGLLANVARVSAYLRKTCAVGPIVGFQGAGFLAGLKTAVPAKEIQQRLLAQNILCGTSGDPNILRLLPPYTLREEHVDLLAAALAKI
jgi:acetylornithine/succinyldiaminopimelate/putrescine aminotransferase